MKPGRIFRKPYPERYADALKKFFRDNKIQLHPGRDIFYIQWVPEAWLVLPVAKVLGIPTAVLTVGDDVLILPRQNEGQMNLFQEVMLGCDIRLAVAQYLADEANKLLPQKVPFSVVRRGVNHDFFRPFSAEEKGRVRDDLGLPRDRIVILMVGTAIVAKGWLDLLDALQELKTINSDFILAAVYGSSNGIDVAEEARIRGLAAHFVAIGEVEPAKMNQIHNAADIFCLPSHSEGIANSVVEAMATGVPVVTTAICGHPELIANGVTGIMVAPCQPHELFSLLHTLVSNAELRERIGNAARNFIVNEWGDYAHNATKLYEILAGEKPPPLKPH
jgi:glycosyltransferase involved in cell wall biosynthesis